MAVADIIREEGLQEGIYRGKLEGLAFVLELKYGNHGLDFYSEIKGKLNSLADIENIKGLIKKCDNIEELKKEMTT